MLLKNISNLVLSTEQMLSQNLMTRAQVDIIHRFARNRDTIFSHNNSRKKSMTLLH